MICMWPPTAILTRCPVPFLYSLVSRVGFEWEPYDNGEERQPAEALV